MLQSLVVIIFIAFWALMLIGAILRFKAYQKNRAAAWLSVARALTSKSPKQIQNVLNSHNKFLDKHITQALLDRKNDLEVEVEIENELKTQRVKNDQRCN